MENIIDVINNAAEYIADSINFTPEIAIILGSGLGPLADEVQSPVVIKYSDIPGFHSSTVKGHAGELVCGMVSDKKVIVMSGRFHYYEGHDMDAVTLPIRVFAKLGIKKLIVTNAAGGIKPSLNPGSIMLITDHLSYMCPSPLRGPNLDEFGPRFKDMTEVYTKEYIEAARMTAKEHNIPVDEGVYCFFRGPQYETPAEIRGIAILGADAAGMSTVPEAIVARHCGMKILGISLITNKAAGLSSTELSHSEVTATAKKAELNMVTLVKNTISRL